MLNVHNISISFDGRSVLDSFDIDIEKNEVLAIIGPSGSGKSTLLQIIAGLIVPDNGTVSINGVDASKIPAHQRNVGMVFQDNQLFPHMNLEQNIEYGLRMKKVPKSVRKLRVIELLALMNLTGYEKRKVDELSGGEAKRVALARSLAPSPAVLLLDEPLTGLDKELHDQLAIELKTLLKSTNTTALLVTHDIEEATTIADRIVKI